MPIYFLWNDDAHPANDLKVFELVISQREGEVALAKLKVLAENALDARLGCGQIIYEGQNGDKLCVVQREANWLSTAN